MYGVWSLDIGFYVVYWCWFVLGFGVVVGFDFVLVWVGCLVCVWLFGLVGI